MHATGFTTPMEDASQDVKLISGRESDGLTVMRFSRKLNTCDKDDMPIGVSALCC